MIRFPDRSSAALWDRPASDGAQIEAHRASTWFDADAAVSACRLSGDPNPEARGLGVDQHAGNVLAHLCGTPVERG